MDYEIDARGLACPLPVMKTSKALDEINEGTVVIIVDNAGARDNVTRLAKGMGCTVSVTQKQGDYYLTITKQ